MFPAKIRASILALGKFKKNNKHKKRTIILTSILASILVVGSLLIFQKQLFASPESWMQTSWSGGATTNTGVHPTNASNWTEYGSKDSSISATTALSLQTTAGSQTQTTDTDFNAGNNSSTTVFGMGSGADVKLSGGAYAVQGQAVTQDYSTGVNPYGVAFDNITNSVWVANYGSNTVSKINITTGTKTDYATGTNPRGVAFDNVTNSVWVANYSSNTVSKINISTGTKTDYATGTNPWGVAFDNVTSSVWVVNYGSNTVSKIDITTGTKTDYATGTSPTAVAFDNVTNSVWVGNYGGFTVSKININTGTKTDYNTGGTSPLGVAFDNVTNSVWVANYGTMSVSKININTGTRTTYATTSGSYPAGVAFDNVTNSVWVAMWGSSSNTVSKFNINTGAMTDYNIGSSSQGVVFDNVTNSIWLSNYSSTTVSKISVVTAPSYATGTSPYYGAFDNVTNSVWLSNYTSNTVSKINITTGTKADYTTGTNPQGVTFDNVTNSVWVANWGSNTVSKINITTGTKADYATGTNPRGVAFDNITNSVWVANSGSNTISKINITNGTKTDYATGSFPFGVAFDNVTNSVWVTNSVSNNVSKIGINTGTKTDYATGSLPYGVAFDNVTNSVWVANQSSNTVSKINITTGAKTDYVTGSGPYGVAFDNVTNSVWVVNNGSSTVSKFRISSAYPSSGTFTSASINTGQKSTPTTLSFTKTTPTNTTLTIDARAGNTATPDGTWTAWQTDITSGASIASLGTKQYFQYRANLATTDTAVTPTLSDLTLNYNYYPTDQTLISSSYNTNLSSAIISKLRWSETLPSGTDVKFQLRTSGDNSTWSAWCGPNDNVPNSCNSNSYFTDPTGLTESIDDTQSNKTNDQFVQYKAVLVSDGANTPTLSDLTLDFRSDLATITGVTNNTTYFEDKTPIIQNGTATLALNNGTPAAFTSGTPITQNGTYTLVATNGTPAEDVSVTFTILKDKTIVDPTPEKITADLSSHLITIQDGTASSTSKASIKLNYTLKSNNASLTIPKDTDITKTNNGNIDITALTTQNITNSIQATVGSSKAAIKIGIPNVPLTFSQDVTINLPVSSSYNNETLIIYTRQDNTLDWTKETTCVVSNSICSFTTRHATEYTANFEVSNSAEPTHVNMDINSTITISCKDANTETNDYIAMNPITGTGKSTPNANNDVNCNVITNNSSGYSLSFVSSTPELISTTDSNDKINSYTPHTANTPEAWNISTADSEWGARLESSSTTYNPTTWGTAGTDDYTAKWYQVTNSNNFILANRSTETNQSGDNQIIRFGAEIGSNKFQPTGTYTDNVTFTAVTN